MARRQLRLLYLLFKVGLWWTEAVGIWMVRLADLYRALARYEGTAGRAVVVVGRSMTLALWGVSRLTFLALYGPTRMIQEHLSAAGY